MPVHDEHIIRQINCRQCFTNEELEAEVQALQAVKLPSAPGERSKPKRADATAKPKKKSWLDDLIGD